MLSNVVRHSRATTAGVIVEPLVSNADGWELRVEDKGAGFHLTAAAELGGQGLGNIRERRARIDSGVEIRTVDRRGDGGRRPDFRPALDAVSGQREAARAEGSARAAEDGEVG